MSRRRRVGITGYAHEVNAFAAPVGLEAGRDASRGPGGLRVSWEAGPLVARLDADPMVEVVDLPVWEFGASGPLDDGAFADVVDAAVQAVRAAAPLDAVVVLGHGGGRSMHDLDTDATFLEVVRAEVGSATPLVVVLDFHANLSERMCAAVDVVVGYLTNPHVDIAQRLVEAAEQVLQLLDGTATSVVWCRLPLVLPQIAQLTAPDEPFGRVTELAKGLAAAEPAVRNVSVFGGFSLADVPCSGASVCVTVDRDAEAAGAAVVRRVAHALWDERPNYRLRATPLADVLPAARDAAARRRAPVIVADVADNPGGGAPATSTALLHALVAADIDQVVLGLQCDPAVVDAAWRAGVGRTLRATFNAGSTDPLAQPFTADVTVTALVDAPVVPARGVFAGQRRHPGRSCALRVGGVHVGVSSRPLQCADPDTLEHVGLAPASARVVVVKSRGHFRAGFEHLFAPEQVVEAEAPGVATPALHLLHWEHLPRPVFPLDAIDDFEPIIHSTPRCA